MSSELQKRFTQACIVNKIPFDLRVEYPDQGLMLAMIQLEDFRIKVSTRQEELNEPKVVDFGDINSMYVYGFTHPEATHFMEYLEARMVMVERLQASIPKAAPVTPPVDYIIPDHNMRLHDGNSLTMGIPFHVQLWNWLKAKFGK